MTNNLPSRQLILRDILGHPTQTLALFRLVTQSFSYGERPSACEAIGFVANRGYSSSYLTGVLRLGKKLIPFFKRGHVMKDRFVIILNKHKIVCHP